MPVIQVKKLSYCRKTMQSFLLLILCLWSINSILHAQITGAGNDFDFSKLMQQQQPAGADLLKAEAIPTDNIIHPAQYRVGPGDVLAIQILSGTAVEQLLAITPENAVMLPRIGEVSLLGKTLAQAKDTIIRILKKRMPAAEISVMLRKSRTIYVTLRGNVRYPGTYALPASMKVSTAVRLANQPARSPSQTPGGGTAAATADPAREAVIIEAQKTALRGGGTAAQSEELPSVVARNITVLHADGTADNVDLDKALGANDLSADPSLRESDQIYVPFENGDYEKVTIAGAVRRPVSIAYKPGDKASMLLRLAYGLAPEADPSQITLEQSGTKINLTVQPDGSISGNDPLLEAGAVILVQKKNSSTRGRNSAVVEIVGAVQKPGAYTIEPGTTKLKECIAQAGGLDEKAYLPLGYIVRREQQLPASVDPRSKALSGLQYTDLSVEDTSRYLLHSMYRKPAVACDFAKAFSGSEQDNVLLEDGDIIVIPVNPRRVYVYGQVNSPGYVAFQPGKTMEWYIQKAGGYAAGAEKDLTRIIKGRSKVWVKGDDEKVIVESGDEIYVAPPSQKPPGYDFQYYSFLITAFGGVISLLNIVLYYALVR
jgi:protein involved in polysaccharide export with SLBB domain